MSNDRFNGIVLYSIERNGCLNGVYTNETAERGVIYNEVARKKKTQDNHDDEAYNPNTTVNIEGDYDCHYFDINNERHACELKIERQQRTNVYKFTWTEDNELRFTGIGYVMNHNQVAVTYW